VIGAALGLLLAGPAGAEPTRITVRVLSKDAKFLGTSMGGARVVIQDAGTDEILAQGITSGATGDTDKIMRQAWVRKSPLSTEGSAAFTAELDLEEPRQIRVSATGPLSQPQAVNTVSATQWVVPGKHIEQGDAFLLMLPGFALEVLSPAAYSHFEKVPMEVQVEAHLVMM
jgi:hypothetical protein